MTEENWNKVLQEREEKQRDAEKKTRKKERRGTSDKAIIVLGFFSRSDDSFV